jgi:hypothetical protein
VEGAFLQFAARNLYMQGDLRLSETYSRLSAVLDKSLAIRRIFYLGLLGTLTAAVIGKDIKHPRARWNWSVTKGESHYSAASY